MPFFLARSARVEIHRMELFFMNGLRRASFRGMIAAAAFLASFTGTLQATAQADPKPSDPDLIAQSNSSGTNQANIVGDNNTVNQDSGPETGVVGDQFGDTPPWFHFVATGTTLCLTGTGTAGQAPTLAPCATTDANQQWFRNPNHSTSFQNRAHPNLCLQGSRTATGGTVLQEPCTGDPNQLWIPFQNGSPSQVDVPFVNAQFRDRCIGRTGTNVVLSPCSQTQGPRWHWGFPTPTLAFPVTDTDT